jgi:hypothetical protein
MGRSRVLVAAMGRRHWQPVVATATKPGRDSGSRELLSGQFGRSGKIFRGGCDTSGHSWETFPRFFQVVSSGELRPLWSSECQKVEPNRDRIPEVHQRRLRRGLEKCRLKTSKPTEWTFSQWWVAPIGLLLGGPSHNGGWHRLGEGGTRHRTVGGTEWFLLLCHRASLATSVDPTRERIG